MKEKELEIGRNRFYFERTGENEDQIVITRFAGTDPVVEVPEKIEGLSVTIIGKKAFLSRKTLKKIILPDTIKEVGDWAFAYCDELEDAELWAGDIVFGKAVFLECGKLKAVSVGKNGGQTAHLMAAAVKNGAYYLLDARNAGSREWLSKWDARMMTVLNAGDRDGYSRQVLCGEEDYGSTNLDEYMRESRRKKIRLLLLRLLNPNGLEEGIREIITDYCLMHTKGCESEETWEVIKNEHGEDRPYYELFAAIGGLNGENIGEILEDIGESCPEMKAYFLDFHEKETEGADFFDGLFLD